MFVKIAKITAPPTPQKYYLAGGRSAACLNAAYAEESAFITAYEKAKQAGPTAQPLVLILGPDAWGADVPYHFGQLMPQNYNAADWDVHEITASQLPVGGALTYGRPKIGSPHADFLQNLDDMMVAYRNLRTRLVDELGDGEFQINEMVDEHTVVTHIPAIHRTIDGAWLIAVPQPPLTTWAPLVPYDAAPMTAQQYQHRLTTPQHAVPYRQRLVQVMRQIPRVY